MTKNCDFVLLFDGEDLYKVKVEDGSMELNQGLKITNLQVIDDEYMYSLANESKI